MFENGQRVKHKVFGKGLVIETRETGIVVLFENIKVGMKKVAEDDLELYREPEKFKSNSEMEQRIEWHKDEFVCVRTKHEEGKDREVLYTRRPL